MSNTYRERVWQAIANSLGNATGHYGDVCDTVREAVMAVRDAELAQAHTERDQAQKQYTELLGQRDRWWDFVGKERRAYSDLLRGMARRVDAWRASRRVLEVQVRKQGELIAELRTHLAKATVLPDNYDDGFANALDTFPQSPEVIALVELVESWQENNP